MASIKHGVKYMTKSVKPLFCNQINTVKLTSCGFSTSNRRDENKSYKLLVVGGGCGGLATGSMFSRKLGKGQVAILEPREMHNYQPMWTLIGGGLKQLSQSEWPNKNVFPKNCDWIKDKAVSFDPDNCTVTTGNGDLIHYEYMIVAMGLQLNGHLIKGLPEALESDPQVCSNYWKKTVTKTFPAIQNTHEGNAIFTYPNSPIKCAGAPQKIMYLADAEFRKVGKRDKINVKYYTSLPAIFGVKKYAEALMKVVNERDLELITRTHLIEVKHESRECVFENLDTKETTTQPYSFLHVTPPMSTPDVLKASPLVDAAGYVSVEKETLQHTVYPNVFAIGDNANSPNAKTAAAIAQQTTPVFKNLSAVMEGKPTGASKYNGYASCPLVTGNSKCILAEFNWSGEPLETLPINQAKERRISYFLKAHFMPSLYWRLLLNGYWHGPTFIRKALRFGFSK